MSPPPGGSDRGIADPMATAGLQLGYGGDQSLAAGSGGNGLGPQPPLNLKQNLIGVVAHLASSTEAAASEVLTTKEFSTPGNTSRKQRQRMMYYWVRFRRI